MIDLNTGSRSGIVFSRRALLGGAGAMAVAGAMPAFAQQASPVEDIILSGGLVLTMEPGQETAVTDIHVKGGEIVKLAPKIDVPGARGGAAGLGLSDRIGSLSVGKRADIIAVRMSDLNTVSAMTPEFALTHSAQPGNVLFVMVEGKIHKHGGRLTNIDVAALTNEAEKTMADLRQKAGL